MFGKREYTKLPEAQKIQLHNRKKRFYRYSALRRNRRAPISILSAGCFKLLRLLFLHPKRPNHCKFLPFIASVLP